MEIRCVWEHNGSDSLLYCENLIGAYTRGESREAALAKMPGEISDYLAWRGAALPDELEVAVTQEKSSALNVRDADSDVIFESERPPMALAEYEALEALALRSAADFLELYQSVPQKDKSVLAPRETFYGAIPRTAEEMYQHTKNVNSYYFGELGVDADNEGTILNCRRRGFACLRAVPGFLERPPVVGSYDEEWSLRKLLRRFLWHDRIHAKAMWRMAEKTFGAGSVPNPFRFG